MEVDGLNVSHFIARASIPGFDALDAAIHTLIRSVARLQYDGIENAPQMFLDGSSHLFDRSQATLDRLGIPLLPGFLRPGATDIVPELQAQCFNCDICCSRILKPSASSFPATSNYTAA